MNSVLQWLGERLSEKSTWAGIGMIVAALGLKINPDYWNEIITIGTTVGGALLVFIKEKPSA